MATSIEKILDLIRRVKYFTCRDLELLGVSSVHTFVKYLEREEVIRCISAGKMLLCMGRGEDYSKTINELIDEVVSVLKKYSKYTARGNVVKIRPSIFSSRARFFAVECLPRLGAYRRGTYRHIYVVRRGTKLWELMRSGNEQKMREEIAKTCIEDLFFEKVALCTEKAQ